MDYKNIDLIARNVMGFNNDEIISYTDAVNHYCNILNYYATSIADDEFLNLENYEVLNYCFNHCTGWVLLDYINEDEVDTCSALSKAKDNKNYDRLLKAANKIVERFYQYKLNDIAESMAVNYFIIANAIYDYEKSFDNQKVYS